MSEDAPQVSALMMALYTRQTEAAERLRAEVDEVSLFEAAALGEVGEVERALKRGTPGVADRSVDGFTALHLAAFFARAPVARLLLARGADPNAVASNPSGVRPLHSAVAARAEAVAGDLLDAGAEVDAAQEGGWTALMAAAMHGHVGLVSRLLASGADPGLAAAEGQTARSLATPEVRDLLT